MDIVDKCSFSGMKLANENIKFDFVHNTKPNPEFENPGMLYRKGKYIFRYKNYQYYKWLNKPDFKN